MEDRHALGVTGKMEETAVPFGKLAHGNLAHGLWEGQVLFSCFPADFFHDFGDVVTSAA